MWNRLTYWIKRILTRPRVILASWRKVGLAATLNLVRIRLGSRDTVYEVRVPQWPHPVYLRGGNSSDSVVLYEILVSDEYGFMGDLGSPESIIDGGANIGMASLLFLNRYPGARVIAVEPDAKTCDLCRKNLAPYADRVTVLQGAIWSRPGRVHLDPSAEEWSAFVTDPKPGEDGLVEAFTMPWLIANHCAGRAVDLLKLDVEGGEREIFDGHSPEWLAGIRNIVIELHGPDCRDRFFSAMKSFSCDMSNRDSVYFCSNLRAKAGAGVTETAAV